MFTNYDIYIIPSDWVVQFSLLFDSSSAGAFDAPSMRSSGPSASPGIGRLRPAFRAGLRMGAREWLLFRLLASSGHAAAERVREGLRLRPGYGAVRRCATGVNGAGACMASIHGHGVLEVHWGVLLASAVWPLGALRAQAPQTPKSSQGSVAD